MRLAITRMLTRGEVSVPKLFGYMLDAIQAAGGSGASHSTTVSIQM